MTFLPNSPEARQDALRLRLDRGLPLNLAALAEEFGVSTDSIRRDLKALEAQGHARCIRGGALPVTRPAAHTLDRLGHSGAEQAALAATALPLIENGMVLMMDGGTSVLALAQGLPHLPDCLVVTPAPAVALATLAAGIPTHLVGGRLSGFGAVAVGHETVTALDGIAADLAFIGVCGLDAGFGLSADDPDEAHVKRAMIASAHRAVVLTGAAKLGLRARHRVAPCTALDLLITDATTDLTAPLAASGLEIRHV
ncbi:DeoR/GlpR family DNA-binding transcription regulator [Sagittula sp.]|uniref:DeoR/GlpR family DNA-binding transcription regulator n=1 Tax=Sagittula sp. TaxID=2038081 RepID=UPI003510FFC3